jgi:hypothetical protein
MGFAILHLKFALEGQESAQAGLRPAWPCAGYGPASYWNIWKKNQKQCALGIPCCCIPSGWASNGKNR